MISCVYEYSYNYMNQGSPDVICDCSFIIAWVPKFTIEKWKPFQWFLKFLRKCMFPKTNSSISLSFFFLSISRFYYTIIRLFWKGMCCITDKHILLSTHFSPSFSLPCIYPSTPNIFLFYSLGWWNQQLFTILSRRIW